MSPRPLLVASLLLGLIAAGAPADAAAPAPPSVSFTSARVTEGSSGLTPFKVQATLQFSSVPVAVVIEAMPRTASADDFVFTPVTLTLSPGVPQEISGAVVGDKMYEGDETFAFTAKRADGLGTLFAFDLNEVTIVDDDQGGAPKLDIDAVTKVTEGNDGWHAVDVAVHLAPAATGPVTVDFQTTGGMAVFEANGVPFGDYRGKQGTLTFAPGETSKTVSVEVLGDKLWETDTSFNVALSNAHGAVLGTDLGKVVLTNDDATTGLTIDDVEVPEGNAGMTTLLVHIKFNPVAVPNSKVWLTIEGLTATDGDDFTGGGFQVLYPTALDQTEITYPLQILGDTRPECDEVLTIKYRGVYTGDDTMKTARVTILDDDAGPKGSCPPSPTTPPTPPAEPAPDAATPQDPPVTPGADMPPMTTTDGGGSGGEQTTTSGGKAGQSLPDRGGCAVGGGGTPSAFALAAIGVALLFARRRR